MKNEIKKFINTVLIYLILVKLDILFAFTVFTAGILSLFLSGILCHFILKGTDTADWLILAVIITTLFSPVTTYWFAKILKIFKKLSVLNLGFLVEFFIIILISVISYFLLIIGFGIPKDYLMTDIYKENTILTIIYTSSLIPAFLLYKFFNFLTRKFPTPFKQIGYFFSIDFYRDLYRKLKNKI